jgi:hypothetical protein
MTATAVFNFMLMLSSGPLLGACLFLLSGVIVLVTFAHLVKAKLPKRGIAVHVSDNTIFKASHEETTDERSHPADQPAQAA